MLWKRRNINSMINIAVVVICIIIIIYLHEVETEPEGGALSFALE